MPNDGNHRTVNHSPDHDEHATVPGSVYTRTTLRTPIGFVLLVATDEGLATVGLPGRNHDALILRLTREHGARRNEPRASDLANPESGPASRHLEQAAAELAEYFAGSRTQFEVALDRPIGASFATRAQHALTEIPFGQTITYQQLAERAGNSRAVRAAGNACAANPLPIVVPCHRVLPASGSVGNYAGGPEAKRFLLDLERTAQ